MKTLISFAAIMLLGSCVSFKDYSDRLSYYNRLSFESDSITNEFLKIRTTNEDLQKQIAAVNFDIVQEIENNKIREVQVNKKFSKLGIRTNLSHRALWYVNYHPPCIGERMYNEFMKKNSCRNPDNARNVSWLSEKEKDTYYWLNYVRMYPKDFCDQFILPLHNQTAEKNNVYIVTLMDYLYNMKPLNALTPDKQAFESARCHAVSSGKEGHRGHIRLKGCPERLYTECLSYNKNSARDHIVKLLLSEDSRELHYRKYLLDLMSSAGIAYSSHNELDEILVIDMLNK